MSHHSPQGPGLQLSGARFGIAGILAAAGLAVLGGQEMYSQAADPPGADVVAAAVPAKDVHGDPLPANAIARLGTTRFRHGSNVTFVAFRPDGGTLITAGQDNTARLWDLATGKEIRRFNRPNAVRLNRVRPVPPPKSEPTATGVDATLAQLQSEQAKLLTAKSRLDAAIGQQKNEAEKKKLEAEKARLETQIQVIKEKIAQAAAAQRLAGVRAEAGTFLVAVSRDGAALAVASSTVIQLIDVDSGKSLRKIDGLPAGVNAVRFSPAGDMLAARGGDGEVAVWETATGTLVRRIALQQPSPESRRLRLTLAARGLSDAPGMAFAPDGKSLAVATTEYDEQTLKSSVKIWEISSGKELVHSKGPDGGFISAVEFSPAGDVVAFAAANVIHLCEADTGKEFRQIQAQEPIASMVYSPDGNSLAVRGRSQQMRLWDVETGKERFRFGVTIPIGPLAGVVTAPSVSPIAEARNVAFSLDGRQLVAAAGSTVRIWDAASGKEVPLSSGHQDAIAAISFASDNKAVVSLSTDRMIGRWDATTGKFLGSVRLPVGPTVLAPDGRTAAVASPDNTIYLIDTATGRQRHKIPGQSAGVGSLAFTPDSKVLAVRGSNNAIRLYDAVAGKELRVITAPAASAGPAGAVVAIAGRVGAARAGIAFSPDGQLLAAPGTSSILPGTRTARNTIDVFDVSTGKLLRSLEWNQPAVSIAFSPDSRVLAAEYSNNTIDLWEIASGKMRAPLGKFTAEAPANLAGAPPLVAVRRIGGAESAGPVTLAFSPDSRALAARGPNNTVRVWDVAGGHDFQQLSGHEGKVETVAFSPDGKTIASGSSDTTILLWNAANVFNAFPPREHIELSAGMVEQLWVKLADEDAWLAYQSMLKLIADPNQAVPLLRERLVPVASVDLRQVEQWIADLESEKFSMRQQAAANLLKTGEQAAPALQKVLTTQPTIETRKRVEVLLDKLTGGKLTSEQLRQVRAVEALERMDTLESDSFLQKLAGGAAGALQTRHAQAALQRRTRR